MSNETELIDEILQILDIKTELIDEILQILDIKPEDLWTHEDKEYAEGCRKLDTKLIYEAIKAWNKHSYGIR
jgi:hypothetical protein